MKKINSFKNYKILTLLLAFSLLAPTITSANTISNTVNQNQNKNNQANPSTLAKSKSASSSPEIDYKTVESLDKAKLIQIIKCLTTKGVNSETAIKNCLPLVITPPPTPTKKDISAVPTVKVTYPNGGEKLIEGTTVRIKYSASSTNSVDVKLWNSLSPTIDIATNIPANGYYDWKVKATAGYGADYAIGIRAKNANGSTYDVSDTYIKIIASATTSTTTALSTEKTPEQDTSLPKKTITLDKEQVANAQNVIEKVRSIIKAFIY